MKRIGLIVNPIAGLGGRVGLKGSDGIDIQQKAVQLGAVHLANERARVALAHLLPMKAELEVLSCPGGMGEIALRQAGFDAQLLDDYPGQVTTAADTQRAVREMLPKELDLLLFAGGDGTARDIYSAGGSEIPALGIPAGVKIHSAVYATHPHAAGELAVAYLEGRAQLAQAEVMDLDEDAFRGGIVAPRLYGYLNVPYESRYVQGVKASSGSTQASSLHAIAAELAGRLQPGKLIILGPGSTLSAIAAHLGWQKTLLGVDAYVDGKVVGKDMGENELLDLLKDGSPAEIIVTPIGGQGCIFGRGNQQISPAVLRKVDKKGIIIVSTKEKLDALGGHPLWVDTGDDELDQELCGYYPVITGYKEVIMYKVAV